MKPATQLWGQIQKRARRNPNAFLTALDAPTAINDARQPAFVFKAGTRHRIRLTNITPDETLTVTLQTKAGPVNWRPITKDGAPVPAALCKEGPAQHLIVRSAQPWGQIQIRAWQPEIVGQEAMQRWGQIQNRAQGTRIRGAGTSSEPRDARFWI